MKKTLLLAMVLLLFACNEQPSEQQTYNEPTVQEQSSEPNDAKYGRQNFAIIWKWKTNDAQLVIDNSVAISNELTKLWKRDIVENAYYDPDSKIDKFENYPNISFFLKVKNRKEAKSILDKLTVVRKDIADYTIHPVGSKWLGRKTDVINKKGITNSYVSVWTTLGLHGKPKADKLLKEQNDMMLELWKNGTIENVYFDMEGEYTENDKTDFVFFVNAKTEEEARAILDNLPFTKKKIASYKLLPVGVFWMGEYKDYQ